MATTGSDTTDTTTETLRFINALMMSLREKQANLPIAPVVDDDDATEELERPEPGLGEGIDDDTQLPLRPPPPLPSAAASAASATVTPINTGKRSNVVVSRKRAKEESDSPQSIINLASVRQEFDNLNFRLISATLRQEYLEIHQSCCREPDDDDVAESESKHGRSPIELYLAIQDVRSNRSLNQLQQKICSCKYFNRRKLDDSLRVRFLYDSLNGMDHLEKFLDLLKERHPDV